jgi:hypothetical protein
MRGARTLTGGRVAARARRASAALAFAGLTLLGCDRKAPGPTECTEFAEAFLGYSRSDEHVTFREQAEIDEVTQLCLTAPYDRNLIACARSTHRARACFDVYKERTRRAP